MGWGIEIGLFLISQISRAPRLTLNAISSARYGAWSIRNPRVRRSRAASVARPRAARRVPRRTESREGSGRRAHRCTVDAQREAQLGNVLQSTLRGA